MVRNREIRNRQHCVHVPIYQLYEKEEIKKYIFFSYCKTHLIRKFNVCQFFKCFPFSFFYRKNVNNLNVKASQGLSEVSSICCISYIDQFFLQKEISCISAKLKHKYHRDKNRHNLFRFYSRV